MRKGITIHIVDNEDEDRESLAFRLSCAGFAVHAHQCASAFLDQSPPTGKCCLLTELTIPGIGGLELLERLKARQSHIPAIVVSRSSDVAAAVQAMKAGAVDFIEKPFADDVLIAAIQAATAHLDGPVEDRSGVVLTRFPQLSERERQVLSGIVDGLQNKQIAFGLGISARTVEVHRANVMTKMKARNLPQLMKMVIPVVPLGNGLQPVN